MKIKESRIYKIFIDEKNIGWIKSTVIIILSLIVITDTSLKIGDMLRTASPEVKISTYVIYAHQENNGDASVRSFIIPFAINTTFDIDRAVQIIMFVDGAHKVQLVSWQSIIDVRKSTVKNK
jgi:hypothetical protein